MPPLINDKNPFPVPRAKAEFSQLLAFPKGFSLNGGLDVKKYRAFAGPYGPLDIQVTKAGKYTDASLLKNIYLGVSGRIVGLDRQSIMSMPSMILCGNDKCLSHRINLISKNKQEFIKLSQTMASLKNVNIVAQWWQTGSYRVNSVFITERDIREAIPSEEMGFIPSGKWNYYRDTNSFAKKKNINISNVLNLIQTLKEKGIRAIKHSGFGGYDIIIDGISDNTFGVLVLDDGSTPPEKGHKTTDGFKYNIVKNLGDNLYYYETT